MDPMFTQPQQFFSVFAKLAAENLSRLEALSDQVGRAQTEGVERSREAVDEAAKLMKATLDYANTLSTEWRKLTLETTRRATEMATARG